MTREEEMAKVSREEKTLGEMMAFRKGVEWADEHPHWISVEDEMPKDGQYVATINTVGVKDVRHYYHGKWYSNFGNEYDDITHWMPLPQTPKKGGEE